MARWALLAGAGTLLALASIGLGRGGLRTELAAVPLYSHPRRRQAVMARQQRLEMLDYKENLPDKNPFEDFDKDYKAPPYISGLADKNVFDKAEEDEGKQGSYSKYEPEKSVLDEMPDEYPFNELKGGHTWHEWQGESVMDALGEHNALDDGNTKEESYELGEHSLGRPFKKFKPAKNVYDGLDDKPHKWGITQKSIPEKNVLDGLSPNTGYDAMPSK